MGYLDETGLAALWEDVEQAIDDATQDAIQPYPTGGLTLKDGALSIGSLAQSGSTDQRGGEVPVSGPIAHASAKGWAEQDTTTGKNLCRYGTSNTNNGVTFTVNANGSVTANGTANDTDAQITIRGIYLSAGIYTISGCPDGGGFGTWNIYPWDYMNNARPRNTTNTEPAPSDLGSGASFLAVDGHEYGVRLRVQKGAAATNLTFYPQLELGSTATSYEPYTGGAPSPSPDYPQEIRVAQGRNLLDESTSTQNAKVSNDGTIGSSSKMVSDFIEIEPNTEYYVSNGVGSNGGNSGAFYDSAKQFIALIIRPSGYSVDFSFETPTNAAYVRLEYYPSGHEKYVGPPQLTLGSTPTPYVPYGYVGLEVRGRNLLPPQEPRTLNGVTLSYDSDGALVLNGTASANTRFTRFFDLNNAGGTYAISSSNATNVSKSGTYVGVGYSANRDINQQDSDLRALFGDTTNATDTRTVTTFNYWVVRIASGASFSNFTIYPQLELGSTPHAYQPYCDSTTPIPLPSKGFAAALPDGTADELSIDAAGRWEWENRTNEYVVDNVTRTNAQYSLFETAAVGNLPQLKVIKDLPDNASLCSNYRVNQVANANMLDPSIKISILKTFVFRDTRFADATEANTWLSTHPVTVLYPLATPTTEQGYVDLPRIPGTAQVSIPELESLGLRFWVDSDGSIHALADAYHARTLAEVARATDEATEAVLGSVAPMEGDTASTNYAQGSYLVFDGKLCKVTSAIATGESIAIGTNVAATTVAAEILAINS